MATKRENLADPNSCWNKAQDDEPVFVLLGRDVASPAAIVEWIDVRVFELNKNTIADPQISDALSVVAAMREWQKAKR